jgi:hypothetical protein
MYLYFICITLIKICHSSIGAGSDKTTVGHNPTIVRELIFWYTFLWYHIYNLLPGFFKGVQPKFQTGTSSGTGLSGKRENAN